MEMASGPHGCLGSRGLGQDQGAQVCSLPLLLDGKHQPNQRLSLEVSAARWRRRPCAQLLKVLSWRQNYLLCEPLISTSL